MHDKEKSHELKSPKCHALFLLNGIDVGLLQKINISKWD